MRCSVLVAMGVLCLGACVVGPVQPTGAVAFNIADCHGSVEACDAACSSGEGAACGYMSQAALVGAGVPRSAERFLAYATRGCDANDGRSCANLGAAYFQSIGVKRDWAKAQQYNERSCRNGFAVGCASLGLGYLQGHGVAQDSARAAVLFAQSCDLGSSHGCYYIAQEAPDGMVPEDRAGKALPLLVHDCDPTNEKQSRYSPLVRLCTVAAKMYQAGRGALADEARATALFELACARGDPDACDHARRR
jgi:TPR repeat protein